MLVYSHCSNNNKASTVLALFQEAVAEYGLPSRVKCDKVCDNLDMARYIILHPSRGPGRGNVIVGKSVHNQRIARLWRDVFAGVLYLYYGLVSHLKESGLLIPTVTLICTACITSTLPG